MAVDDHVIQKDKQAFKRIPIEMISKNTNQPRRIFDADGLKELELSIRRYGVITPLTVRKKTGGHYELVAGERRLRAARMAGLEAVPCYIVSASEEDSGLMALVENLQRRDLDFFEEALAFQRLTRIYGLTQQEAAERVGKTQSSVANKLRLLRLSPEVMGIIRQYALTERHARALLRVEDEQKQTQAATYIAKNALNVERAEAYIENLLAEQKPKQSRMVVVKDVRIFINTVNKAVEMMQRSGIMAKVTRRQEGEDMILTLQIPVGLTSNVSRETSDAAPHIGGI